MNFYNKIVFSYWRGGIDAAASLYCIFPLESSAMHNNKAGLCTVYTHTTLT